MGHQSLAHSWKTPGSCLADINFSWNKLLWANDGSFMATAYNKTEFHHATLLPSISFQPVNTFPLVLGYGNVHQSRNETKTNIENTTIFEAKLSAALALLSECKFKLDK